MNNRYTHRQARGATARAAVLLALAAMVGSLAACDPDELLNVDSPSRIPAECCNLPRMPIEVNAAIAISSAGRRYFVVTPHRRRAEAPSNGARIRRSTASNAGGSRYQAFDCQDAPTPASDSARRASVAAVSGAVAYSEGPRSTPPAGIAALASSVILGIIARGFCSMASHRLRGLDHLGQIIATPVRH